ncbi:hypothetical protein [Mesobacillus foraminis]|uniref:SynChlorMet cassette protein ScmC n=1 Tax=Mesobacillus foraminis TaxID=279826 RepID=A0A4R2B629_9BACI|nr:hypothetical protein [Mesobacillus foraminis]TCN22207.1 hypothetical protein EV146_11144 [Mesobacillus foraminis]
MKELQLQIGDHSARVSCTSLNLMNFFKRQFTVKENAAQVDLNITIHEGYGNPFTNYEVRVLKGIKTVNFQRADYLIEASLDYKSAIVYVHDELALKHALMNLYSSYIVYHNWGLLIHSSCAVETGKAHIFSGHSGAGKSTAASLSEPRELLSDEASIVKITSDNVTIFDSPFRSELNSEGNGQAAPLASIQLLHQSIQNKREQLKKTDALINLVDKVFYWAHSPEESKKVMGLLKTLVSNVPVYELYFKKDNTFWELIS